MEDSSHSPRPVVTISATYGAGGGFIGPQVANRLGVSFVERAISAEVAAELAERAETVEGFEDDLGAGATHWLAMFAGTTGLWGGVTPSGDVAGFHDERSYKRHLDTVLHRDAGLGAVILGRGGQVVLRDVPAALHVRLDGPVERRIAQAVEFGGIYEPDARRAQHRTDAARHRYVHRLYHADLADHRWYHLVIDSTAVPWATCVKIIVSAVQGRDQLRRLSPITDDDPS